MKKSVLLIFTLFSLAAFSQEKKETVDNNKNKFSFSGNYEGNGQWYTNDVNRGIDHDPIPLRSNNYLNLKASVGKFSAGVQVESYVNEALLNYNPQYSKTNIGTYYLNYKSDQLDVTAGYFYEQFGNGIALRTWEDRALGINNALRGGRVVYSPNDNMSFTALYGKQRTGFNVANSDIYGFNAELNLSELLFPYSEFKLTYGGSFVDRDEELPVGINDVPKHTYIVSNRVGLEQDGAYFNGEFAFKSKDALLDPMTLYYDLLKPGNALLLNFGYAEKGFGVDASLRRNENMIFLSEREPTVYSPGNTSLNYNDKFLNYMPGLTKQHHSALSNIYVYQAQNMTALMFSEQIEKFGEIGGQIDLFYEFKKGTPIGGKYGTKIALNAASWFNLKSPDFSYFDAQGNYAPSFSTSFFGAGQKYFSEYSVEVTKKLSPKIKGTLSLINQYYNNQYIVGEYQKFDVNTFILFSEAVFLLPKSKSLTVSLEHMWADADRRNWLGGSIEYNHNSNISVFASDSFNYGFDPNSHLINATDLFDIHFYNFGATYRRGSARVSLSYGRQRGGLLCAGGVCRYVPPSTGLGVQISKSF